MAHNMSCKVQASHLYEPQGTGMAHNMSRIMSKISCILHTKLINNSVIVFVDSTSPIISKTEISSIYPSHIL